MVLGLLPCAALAQIEGVRREQVDAGFHQPVLTRAPVLLEKVDPAFPPEAQAQHLSGDVKLRVTLAADGTVAGAELLEGAGHGFDEAALAAVRQFKFSPAEVDGAPSSIQFEYTHHFTYAPPPAAEHPPADAPLGATLKGEVIVRGSRRRVSGASVRCAQDAGMPEAPEAVTGEDGRFRLDTAAGECQVRVAANGFEPFATKQVLAPGETAEVNFYLLQKAAGFETVVRGERDKTEVVRRTLGREELEAVPGSFGDPIRVIQDLPGVARSPFDLGQLIVRGATPSETDTLLDGVSIPILFHLGGGPSVVNSRFLDRIDFYPGGFGARYGRAIGGIVDVYTRRGAADTLHGEVKVDLLDTDVFIEAPLTDGVSVAAAARRSYIDSLLPAVLPNNLLVVPQYWDYQARMDVTSGHSSYYVMAFGSNDFLKIVSTGTGASVGRNLSLDVHTLFHDVKGDWTYRLGDFTSVLTPYVGYTLAGFGFGASNIRADDYTLGLREDARWEARSWLTVRAGLDLTGDHLVGHATLPALAGTQYVAFPGADQQSQTQDIAQVLNSFDPGLYAEVDFKSGPFTVTPGLRFNYDRLVGHDMSSWDPRLWLRYQVTPTTQLKGSVGLYSQPPDATQMVAPPFGNPFLQEQRALQTSLGVLHKFSDVINLDLTGFYNRRFDLVVSPGPVVQNPDGSISSYQYGNTGVGRAYGLEVMLRHEVTKQLFGWIAYTLSRSEVHRQDEPSYYVSQYDQTHILTAVGSYRLPRGFELGARFRYVTGNPYTPVSHEYDIYAADSNIYYATYGATRSARDPAFNQLDIRLDKYWTFQHWTLDTYLDVQNIYNAHNVETNYYDYRYRLRYNVPGVPFLPVLGVKGTF